MINPEICSPLYKNNKFSCYTKEQLRTFKKKYNHTHTKKIKGTKPSKIWKELNKNISDCKKESCWASKLNVKVDNFAPYSPKSWRTNEDEWLSSLDITAVLKQYEKAYPEFKYIGPSPSDYFFKEYGQCVWPELCAFNVNTTKHKYVGIVFNLDTHDGPGTHWVSLFIDIPKRKIYYFDSTGEIIHENIEKLVKQIQAQNSKFELIQNHPIEHQYGNTECGMYTLFFIITMLETHKYNYFKNKSIRFPDKKIQQLRKKYFNS
jgi:hypothetical protein